MNIPVPAMTRWLDLKRPAGRITNVRDLVRREQERREKIAAMQRLIDEGRASGISDAGMADIRERVLPRAGVAASWPAIG